jgi:asparagine synthase (glutamine-hydrolysing)
MAFGSRLTSVSTGLAELASKPGLPATTPAEQLALAAVSRWRADLPDRLDGDFALAAWDPSRQCLLCARDIVGVRPLCYAWRPGLWFAFASLSRGLHGSGIVPQHPDLIALGRILIDIVPTDAATGYSGISWLPAGHTIVVKNG